MSVPINYFIKFQGEQGGNNALNVYSTSGDVYLGWAYYPDIVTTDQAYLDGIVIDWRSMKGVSSAYAGAYDQGETLTHETGHWVNLAHTFEGRCSPANDFVAGEGLLITPAHSIHMFFMKFAIDAIFINRKNIVVGLVGAVLAGFVLTPFLGGAPITQGAFDIRSLVVSFLGAVVLLGIVNLVRRGSVR